MNQEQDRENKIISRKDTFAVFGLLFGVFVVLATIAVVAFAIFQVDKPAREANAGYVLVTNSQHPTVTKEPIDPADYIQDEKVRDLYYLATRDEETFNIFFAGLLTLPFEPIGPSGEVIEVNDLIRANTVALASCSSYSTYETKKRAVAKYLSMFIYAEKPTIVFTKEPTSIDIDKIVVADIDCYGILNKYGVLHTRFTFDGKTFTYLSGYALRDDLLSPPQNETYLS